MRPYLSEESRTAAEEGGWADGSPFYDLFGVVCHQGTSFYGHYVAMARLLDYDTRRTDIGLSVAQLLLPLCCQSAFRISPRDAR